MWKKTFCDIVFSSNHNIHKSSYGLRFWASDPLFEEFIKFHQLKILNSKIYLSKGLKPKNKGHTNFYQCCDLTKKSISSVLDYLAAIESGSYYGNLHYYSDRSSLYVVKMNFLFCLFMVR